MERQLVIFDLMNEHFGIDIATVDGIIKMQEIINVPHAPSFVEGVTNLRGHVLPVVDLRKRFDLPSTETTRDTRIVVVNLEENKKVGMIVDAVSEVITIPEDAIEPTPPIVTSIDSAFITGIAKIGERLVILLDLAKVLSTQEKAELKAMHAPALTKE
jgi:purine-binding chemotaxis protein CheW